MTADHALRRELSRRIRDDLIALGIVQNGPAVTIADGTQASPGDLIICTKNDHTVEAGEPGRTLANGDLLRIDAVTPGGLIVRRALDADPRTGQRRWTDRQFLFASYENAELGYAVTDHTAQGRTVHTGLAVITGTEDRPHAYVALTRGTDVNTAYVFTTSPKRADPVPGPRPAPELARYDRLTASPGGQPATGAGEALAVLSAVLDRDGQLLSATQTRNQALADADHLALLHAIWAAETTPARDQRYHDLLTAALPPGYRTQPGHQAKWLWRTLRAAELAGLDARQLLADAIGERDLAGARDIPAVIDARLRKRTGSLVPLPPGPWSAQLPDYRRPRPPRLRRRHRRADGRAQGPDRRARRRARPALGRHRPRPGPRAPAGPAGLADAGPAPSAPGASCPATTTPPSRSDPNPPRPRPTCGPPGTKPSPPWPRSTAPTSAACPTARCCTCATPTPSKPPGRRNTSVMSSARSAPPPGTPAWPASAPTPTPKPPSGTATPAKPNRSTNWPPATRPCTTPTGSARPSSPPSWPTAPTGSKPPATSATWPRPPTPNCAAATPASTFPPLRSAEPEPATPAQRDELTLTAGEKPAEIGQWIKDLAAAHRTFAGRLADRQSQIIPSEDPDYGDLGLAFPAWTGPARTRSCSRPSPRSRPPRGSCSA